MVLRRRVLKKEREGEGARCWWVKAEPWWRRGAREEEGGKRKGQGENDEGVTKEFHFSVEVEVEK